ncbi:outer membrane protein assembly factor BamB family protein [Cohnella nanjingensis]|uniref:PQQ-binding-like beta-propeller repeat protein n=1 Tax=Cohnella nanjingensis TaxID=1387779 RepID=A0A7X0VDN4_9BACL|nr:PQQ-binding-like beta-propeller repeat protein [Cohnella nanjingensis]MBB6669866.1 PQQ-binding-like beta-propeller repeat protein [Cohnella nanjingensis]
MRTGTKAALGLLAGVIAAGGWEETAAFAQSAGPNASYEMPGAGFVNPNPVPSAQPKWTADLDAPLVDAPAGLATGNGNVYYLNDGKLIAKQAASGKTLWSYAAKLQGGQIAMAGGFLYVSGQEGSVYRVEEKTGSGKRVYQAKGEKTAPALSVDGGTLYVLAGGTLLSVNLATGKENWRNTDAKTLPTKIGNTLLAGAVESGALTVMTYYAIDPVTGKSLWRLEGDHTGPLKVDGDKLYFRDLWPHNDQTETLADIDEVDLKTGKITATKSFVPVKEGEDPLYQHASKVVMEGSDIYVVTSDRGVFKYNYDSDPAVVQPEVIQNNGMFIAGPYNGKLYFRNGDNRGIEARKIVDKSQVYYEGLNNPVSRLDLIDAGMYVGQTDGQIFALNVATGKALFRFQTSAESYGPFQVEEGTLLAQAGGKLYAFALPAELQKPASGGTTAGSFVKADAKLTIDGQARAFSPSMMTTNNRMFVPFRSLTEALGAKVGYDGATKRTTVTYGDRSFQIADGAPYAVVGGKQNPLSYAPVTLSGSLYVPIKDFGDLLGVSVVWNGGSRTVEVKTKA